MPDLNCTEFESQLNRLVEERRSLAEFTEDSPHGESAIWRDLRARANACSHCRRLWNEFALLERVLPLCGELTPPVDLVDAVISRWREESKGTLPQTLGSKLEQPARESIWRRALPALIVIAASVLAGFAFLWRPANNDLPDMVPIAKVENPELPDEVDPIDFEEELNWRTFAQDAGSAYRVLASDAVDSFATVAVFAPASKPSENPQPTTETKPPAAWTKGLGTGLKPISQDVGRAMSFLLEALPGETTL